MRATHIRVWLAVSGVLLACCGGCTQRNAESSPGDLPGRKGDPVQPRITAATYFAHGHLLERQGSFERAVKQYQRAVELQPEFVTARNRLGITLNKLGRHAEASAEFRRAIAIKPEPAYLHNNLGFSLYLEGKHSGAEAATRRALEITPSFPRARMNHALALAKLGRFDEAFEELCQVGSEADAYYNMAVLQTEAGRYADATRSLDMALRLNPDLEAARQQLREIAVLAARQEAVPVADVAAPEDAPQVIEEEPVPDQSASDTPPEAELTPLIKQWPLFESPAQPDMAEPNETIGVREPAAGADVARMLLDNIAGEHISQCEALELFPEPEPFEWFAEPEPAEQPDGDVFEEPLATDERARSAVLEPTYQPVRSESATELINELITAIVNRSEALTAELWCELEIHLEAAERQNQRRPAPPEPADLLN